MPAPLSSRRGVARAIRATVACIAVLVPRASMALTWDSVEVDPATVITLGVKLMVSGDTNRNGSVTVKYRKQANPPLLWSDGMNLFRVHANPSIGVTEHFAGSIFNVDPGTTYEIQLTAFDPDETVGPGPIPVQTVATRPVPPGPPASPDRAVNVSTGAALKAALDDATPGDVITLGPGTYTPPSGNNFRLTRSGSSTKPIFIRGTVQNGVNVSVIQSNCARQCSPSVTGCAAFDIAASWVTLEDLTIREAGKGVFFDGTVASTGNVARRLTINNVCTGMLSNSFDTTQPQTNYYVCDNDLTGPIAWPGIFHDDSGGYANTVGIVIQGNGHVVCHNRIRSFGDGISFRPSPFVRKTTRAFDIYGNDVLSGYDNGIELDHGQGNVRAFRNRLLNTLSTLSFQPIYGGPAYAFRNISINTAKEQLKFNTNAGNSPSGMLVFHNTFVNAPLIDGTKTGGVYNKAAVCLHLRNEGNTSFNYRVDQNIFFGRGDQTSLHCAYWRNIIGATTPPSAFFNTNGYYPSDQRFRFGGSSAISYDNLAALQAATDPDFENNGVGLLSDAFASGLQGPPSYDTTIQGTGNVDARLNPTSAAVNHGYVVPNINDAYVGSAPDLGALETNCNQLPATYGPRPAGVDERTQPIGCEGIVPSGVQRCTATPHPGCRKASTSKLRIQQKNGNKKLKWQWKKGFATSANFGDPVNTATQTVCVYETAGGVSRLISESVVPPGGNDCHATAPKPCWKPAVFEPLEEDWTYKDRLATPSGVYTLKLRGDDSGQPKARIDLHSRGPYLSLPGSLALGSPVTIQLRNLETEVCWEATFTDGSGETTSFSGFTVATPTP
jgi:hypothetical protein